MRYRLLNCNGKVCRVDERWLMAARKITIESNVNAGDRSAPDDPPDSTLGNQVMLIEFESAADGRGYSLAAELREGDGYNGLLYACGQLNPDQLTLAFQCGFNGVIVDEKHWDSYGEPAWLSALKPVVTNSYIQSRWDAIDSIWRQRQVLVQ